jgi:hypothetical protein
VIVNGATRTQRLTSRETLWNWVDAHGKEFGIGLPYLDRDPPHVAPIDGNEYATHHSGMKARHAWSERSQATGSLYEKIAARRNAREEQNRRRRGRSDQRDESNYWAEAEMLQRPLSDDAFEIVDAAWHLVHLN